MKKRMYLMGAIVLGLSCLGSCSDDDDGLDWNRSITVYGEQYELTEVIAWESNPYVERTTVPYVFKDTYEKDGSEVTDEVVGFAPGPDVKEYGNFMLSLYERGMKYNEELSRISGKGICLSCHLVSPEKDRLVPGKYVFNTERGANTFTAYFSSEYDPEGYITPAIISEGEVNIEENGDEYKVEFQCGNAYGGKVAGTYEGVIRQVKVDQQLTAIYNDLMLSGAMKFVNVKLEFFGTVSESQNFDQFYSNAFFSSATGDCRKANASGKESVDVALIWDRDNNYFRFESPIRMRAMLGHDDEYNFPCHTIYAWAPVSFTDEDFENLDKTGFTFDLEGESEVILGTEPFKGGFVFFKTGQGKKGVIQVKDFTPMGSQSESSFFGSSTIEVAPKLMIDVKSEASFPNPIMR